MEPGEESRPEQAWQVRSQGSRPMLPGQEPLLCEAVPSPSCWVSPVGASGVCEQGSLMRGHGDI